MRRVWWVGLWVTGALVVLALGRLADAEASPTRVSDVWVMTRSHAEAGLKSRFPNIAVVTCSPIRTSPNQVFGTVRYWQRFQCQGRTRDGIPFRLNVKATGECGSCWTISQLKGTGVAHLKKRSSVSASPPTAPTPSPNPPPSAPPPTPPPTTSLCRIYYPNAGLKVGFQARLDYGSYLLLRDGSVWTPSLLDRYKTILWTRFDTVIAVDGSGLTPCRLVNVTRGDVVSVKRATASGCGGSYYPNGGRVVSFDGRASGSSYGRDVLLLRDGSVWETGVGSASTILWTRYDDVMILDGDSYTYPCVMVNLDQGELVEVKRIG